MTLGRICKAQLALAQANEEPVVSGEHLLDVTDREAFAYTGIVPLDQQSITLMYWVKFKTLGRGNQFSGVDDDGNHRLYVGVNSGEPITGVGNSKTSTYKVNKVEADQWVHLAAVFDAPSRESVLYVNGQEVKKARYTKFIGFQCAQCINWSHRKGVVQLSGCEVG